ncbi:MAG TPA: trypsin-like peptidase domain-containing protein [Longimicrobium sp.]|jgi:serine protease Do
MNPIVRKLTLPTTLVVGLGAGLTLADAAQNPLPDLQAQSGGPLAAAPTAPVVRGAPSADALSSAFRAASSAALPAVVFIQVESAARQVSAQVPPEMRGTPFEDFFRGPQRSGPSQSSGSGFIVSADGYVITNNHVVDGASRVKVIMSDRRELDARVVGRDANTDIAVLKVEAKNLPVARLGNSDALATGDWVLALGYPLTLGQTTTAGIVSAKGRSIGIMGRNTGATAPLEHFIQTDAAINPGNSGGPLVDLQGRVVGVNSAIASPTGYYSGYGFAVPIDLAKRIADDLIRYGVVHRPMLGVEIRDAAAADAEVFGLRAPEGAVISSEPKAGARDAGLRLGDVIVAVDGTPVRNSGDLMETVMRKQPGDEVALEVVRYGRRQQAKVKLASFDTPRAARSAAGAPDDANSVVERLGFQAAPVTPQIAQQLRMDDVQGVVVTAVDPSGPAAAQLMPGFRVDRFNGREIRTAAELRSAMESVRAGAVVSMVGRRPDGAQTIVNFRARS